MSKKSKRSKKRSYSSPSREDDEKKRKKRKENKDQRQSEDKYEATNTHGSSTKHAPHHSVVHDEDSSRGRAIRKCVYRQSKTNSHTEESNVKHEGHLKSRLKSHSCHKTSCSKEKTSNVGKTIIIKTSKSVDRRPLTYTSALADPLKHEKSLKTPEKQHVCALIPHAAQKDGKWVALEKTYKFGEDPSNNQNLISNRKEKDSRRSLSVLDDSKRCATIPSYSHPGKKEKHKTTICSHAEETTCTCKPHEKTPPPYKKSNECHTYSLSSVMKRSSGSSLVKDKVWGEKNAKKVLNVKETSFAEKKISVNSAHVPKNTTSKWTSVSSPPKTVKDQRSQKQRKNISCTQQKVNTPKSSAQKVPPRRLKTTESCNSTSSASSKHRPVCAVPAALKMDDKESRAEPLSLSCKTKSTSQALLDEPSTSHDHNSQMWCDQIQIAVELHLARSEKRLEVNIGQSYGELTCMDIDYPDEGVSVTRSKEPQQDLILVLDTNILLSHLDYVKQVVSHGLEGALYFLSSNQLLTLNNFRSIVPGPHILGSVGQIIQYPACEVGVNTSMSQFVSEQSGLDGVESTGEIKNHDPHIAPSFLQVGQR